MNECVSIVARLLISGKLMIVIMDENGYKECK